MHARDNQRYWQTIELLVHVAESTGKSAQDVMRDVGEAMGVESIDPRDFEDEDA